MAGYSGTPLGKKLGLKDDMSVFVQNTPTEYFAWLSPLPSSIILRDRFTANLDFVHIFTDKRKEFESSFLKAKKHLKPTGMLWISWPKKSSKVPTDLDENVIRDFGLVNGLVDVKVCAIDEVWSGLKFVYRLKDR